MWRAQPLAWRAPAAGAPGARAGVAGGAGQPRARGARLARGPVAAGRGHQRGLFFNRRPPRRFLGIEGLETPRDFPRFAQEAVEAARRELAGAPSMGPRELVAALDGASNGLCRVADAAELCRNVHPDEEFVAHASAAVQVVAAYMGDVNLDLGVYEGMRRAEASGDFRTLPTEARLVLQHMRVSMEHEGVHLRNEDKAACLRLLEREQQLSFDIVQRQEQLRRPRAPGGAPPVAGGSEEPDGVWVLAASAGEALGSRAAGQLPRRGGTKGEEELLVPADGVWAEQVLQTSACSTTRRLVHEAQQSADEQGAGEMADLLAVRQQLALLRGYRTWGEYAQREALLSSPDRVDGFLSAAWSRLRAGVSADLEVLAQEQRRLGLGNGTLRAWDMPLLLRTCRREHEREEARISQYLSYASLMRGVELVLSRLLGLSFTADKPAEGEVWHPSVQKYTLRDGDQVLGVLYLDPFMRPGKVVQSAQFTLQGSKELEDGQRQVPVTTLVYSLPASADGLTHSCAITFMHEIGHAVHSLLSETTYQHLSGTRGTVDFVEFPSHLFEHFVLDPSTLATYASHGKSGAAMPADVQQSCRRSRLRFAHFEAAQQLMYAVIDQAFYGYTPAASSSGTGAAPGAADGLQRHLADRLACFDAELAGGPFEGPFTALLGLSRPSKFDHLVHYGGSYYCYLFNRALSAHVWRHGGFQDEPFGPAPGARLRELLRGGSVVQDLGAIQALCPGAQGFLAEDVPLDAFCAQLGASGG